LTGISAALAALKDAAIRKDETPTTPSNFRNMGTPYMQRHWHLRKATSTLATVREYHSTSDCKPMAEIQHKGITPDLSTRFPQLPIFVQSLDWDAIWRRVFLARFAGAFATHIHLKRND
jgi:hypothetical protein